MKKNTQLPVDDNNIPLTVEIVDLVIDMLSAGASRARMEKEILQLLTKHKGATAEHDRAQVLVDALEALKEGAENHTIHFIDKILKQWKSGKGKEVGDG